MSRIQASEHALLRYLERVVGIDLQEIEKAILTEDRKALIRLGAHTIPIGDRMEMIVRNNVVVTIKPCHEKRPPAKRRFRVKEADEKPMEVYVSE